ncbi:hypothetical protein HCN44_002282 [Aphidius gifuensis]|uniref:Death-inducer obliterator 1 n=1 Tax=Aphidius gifuensis TaxID=684658 RepID=A0A834Y274_APHGI|nr:probable serine/threonine-protein kinase DDB_G0282963 isoform X2 [Aphidius gifuensis]KAF7996636.1 hypothetical protein HCN44_002282 [Aphidius gifuensis]
MSSSYIVEPENNINKKDDTLIIVVDDDGTISVDQETLKNLIMSKSNANVSVVRVGQAIGDHEKSDLTFTVDPPNLTTTTTKIPTTTSSIATLKTTTTTSTTTVTTTTTTTTTSESGLVDPFMEMDPEQLEKLETALQSEQAKQILGENVTAMLDMLTVEEQQNSIRYSIELDHCYTSRTSPSDPAPVDPLPVPNSPDIDRVNILESSIPLQIKQQNQQHQQQVFVQQHTHLNQDQKIVQNAKLLAKKSVGRPRKASIVLPSSNIIKTSPGISSRSNTTINHESKQQQSSSNLRLSVDDNIDNDNVDDDDNNGDHINNINAINDAQSSISESSESGPSDDDVDFGPPRGLRGQRRVRARGGRKGLTTRGGTMAGRRGRPNKHHMDNDQVKRLNNEMAAAVDAMKTPGRIDNNNSSTDFSIKTNRKVSGIKTMGGSSGNKRKDDEDDDNNKSVNSSSPSSSSSSSLTMLNEKTHFQTTNQVKANLINANMLKGDMILTKPGQSRNNNQKLVFLQKKSIAKPSELKTISSISSGPSKKQTLPITVAKTNVINNKTIEDPNNLLIKNSDEFINTKLIDNTDKTEISKISKTTISNSSPSSSSSSPTINKINKSPNAVNKKDRKKSENELLSIKIDEQKEKEKGRIIDNNKLLDNKKHSVKKEQRKVPVVSAVVLGPALFSTPDIIRRVGSIGEGKSSCDLSDSHGTSSSNNTSITDDQLNNSTTPMDLDETMKIITSIKTDLQNINNTNASTNTNDNNMSSSSSYVSTTNIINNDHHHHQNKMQLMDIDDDELPKNNTNDDDDLQSALDPGGIEGEENLFATLMDASKHEDELLAEALLLQEQLDVDLGDPSANPLLSPSVFDSELLNPSLATTLQQSQSSSTTIDSTIKSPEILKQQQQYLLSATPPTTPTPSTITTPSTTTTTSSSSSTSRRKEQKEPIQIVRGGRVITLPPIEAPATRSKRSLQMKPESPKPINNKLNETNRIKEDVTINKLTKQPTSSSSLTQLTVQTQKEPVSEMESEMEDDDDGSQNSDSEDDPNRLWCICKRPHNNRFMICCDICEDWFHGKCVNITKAMGKQMEDQGIEWVCPNCKNKKKSDRPVFNSGAPSPSPSPSSSTKTTKSALSSNNNKQQKNNNNNDSSTPKKQMMNKKLNDSNIQSNQLTPTSSTSTTSTKPAVVVHTQCVVCKKEARNSSIYCSDNCILTFAHKTSGKDNKSGTKSTNDEINSVIVLERKTGKVLSGENAPTLANLDNWLKENPTFEQVLLKNINNVQVGNKTFPTIQVQSGNNNSSSNSNSSGSSTNNNNNNNNNNNKTISNKTTPKNQQVQSPKMIYTKIAGSKQTVLTSSNLNSNKSISITTPSATTTPPPVKNLKQTTIKTIPIQPAVASSTPIKKIEQKASSSASPSSSTPSSSSVGGGSSSSNNNNNTKSKTIFSSGSKRGNGIDQNRLNVRKTLSELLTTRMKETDDLKLSEDEISDIAIKIELEMFKFFRDTGTKYKAKYRSLIFNIKDVKNLTLFRKILDKSLKPDEIIKLSPDEMASQELAEWRSKETQHQLEMIKKNELDLMAQAKSIVVKTHKGEQIIENDGGNNDSTVDPSTSVQDIVSVLNNTDNSNFNDSSINEETTTTTSLDDSKKSTTKIDDTDDKKKKKKQKEYKDSKKNKNTKHRSRDRSRDRRHHHHRHSSHSSHNHHSNNKNKNDKRDKNKDKDKSSSSTTTTTTSSSAIQKNNKKETGNNNNNSNKSSNSSSSTRKRSRSSSSSTRKDNNSKKIKSDNEEIIDIINKRETTPLIISTDNKIQELQDVDNNWKHIDEDTTTNTIDDTGNLSDLSDREPTSTVNIKTPDININDEQDNKDNKNINETMMMTVVDDEKISTTIDKLTTSIPMDINQQNYDNIDANANANDDDVNNKSTIWQGVINMSEVAKFYTTAQELNSHTIGLTNDLPNTFDIVGRIVPEIVWDYIAKTKKNGSKEIVILRLLPLNDEEKLSYITLYSYLNKRDRFGVVGKPGKNIKDFYIMPYSIDTKIPPILMPFIGDALKNDRQHLLLGIIVKKKLNITNLTTINNKMLVNKKDASDKTTVTQSTLTTLNKAQIGMSRNNIHIDNTKVSTTTSTIPSSVSSSSSSPLPPLPPSPTQILPPLPPTPLSSLSTITTQPLPPLPPLPPTTTSLDKSIINDDDEPYSPGGIDHDNDNDSGSGTDLLLNKTKSYTATVKNSTELQRKMDELNRQIEAEKKQIQNISSSILTDVGPTLPGLGLDPPGLNDYEEAYSPSDNSRSFTPPPPSSSSAIPSITTTENITKLTQPILDKVSDITIPANLQEILANVKRQETTKIDTYLPSKPGASFLTSSFDTSMLNKKIIDKKIYTPTSSNKDNTSTLRSLSDMDLIKKAEEELAAVAIAEAAATVSTVSSISNNFTTPPPPLPMTLPQLSTALLMSSPPPPLPPLLLPPPSLSLVQNDMQIMTMPADILHQSTTTTTTTTTKIFESEENMSYHESDSMDDTVHEQPRPPGVEDDEFDTFSSSTPSNILINNTLTSEGPPLPPAVLTGVKRKINDDEASPATTATPPKAPRTKSRWGQGPTD